MTKLDIKILADFSGIKAHTIRIWEHRFGLFKPSRTPGNHRVYSVDDLKLLLDLALLLRHGYTISKLSKLNTGVLQAKIGHLSTTIAANETNLNQLIIAYVDSDISAFEDALSTYTFAKGIDKCVQDLVMPFINQVGLFYYLDQRPQTHFVVTALRKKLLHATDLIKKPEVRKQTAILFLPPDQHFDLLLLYVSYELQRAGVKIFYLGTNVAADILETVIANFSPDFLVTYVSAVSKVSNSEKAFLSKLSGFHKNLVVATAETGTGSVNYNRTIPYRLVQQHILS